MVRFFVGEPEPFAAKPQSTPFALGPGSQVITRIAHDLLQVGERSELGTSQNLAKAMETFVNCPIIDYIIRRGRGNFGHCQGELEEG